MNLKNTTTINKVEVAGSDKHNINYQYLVDGYTHIFENCEYNLDGIYDMYISGNKIQSECTKLHLGHVNDILESYGVNEAVYKISKSKDCQPNDFYKSVKIHDDDYKDLVEKVFTYPLEIQAYQTSDGEIFTEKEKAIEHQKRIELDEKIKEDLKEMDFGISDNTLALYISDFIFSNLEYLKKL